jgi:hypothetical protein
MTAGAGHTEQDSQNRMQPEKTARTEARTVQPHSKKSRSIKLPTERRILLLNYTGNCVCYGENYT